MTSDAVLVTDTTIRAIACHPASGPFDVIDASYLASDSGYGFV